LILFANQYLATGGDASYVNSELYNATDPSSGLLNIHDPNADIPVIKADLDFVAGNWRNQLGCDLWEEVRGTHFYTRLVQYRALVDGATFAAGLGDLNGASFYSREAALMVLDLCGNKSDQEAPTFDQFWNSTGNYLIELEPFRPSNSNQQKLEQYC